VRVCYFGRFDPRNPRNTLLTGCLARAGAEVIAIRDDRSLWRRTPALWQRARSASFDLMIVGFRAHSDMWLASRVAASHRVPLIFDPLTSRYEERVVDRHQVSPSSLLARWYRATDAAGCRLADRILLETDAQIDYFVQTFGISRAKCRRVWLGADAAVMRAQPAPRTDARFTVFFYGRFSPLHGIEHIIEAASILEQRGEPVRVVLVGGGQTYGAMRALAERRGVTSLSFIDPVPYAQLAVMMSAADVCLGTFGTNARARRVIPYKVFDALAVGRPVITADTPAIREILTEGVDVCGVPSGDAEALADAVVRLRDDPALRARLAENGHRVFEAHMSPAAIERELTTIVLDLIGRHHGAGDAS
jgi:glycosyltransferase involved in cell wall biosynthesis